MSNHSSLKGRQTVASSTEIKWLAPWTNYRETNKAKRCGPQASASKQTTRLGLISITYLFYPMIKLMILPTVLFPGLSVEIMTLRGL